VFRHFEKLAAPLLLGSCCLTRRLGILTSAKSESSWAVSASLSCLRYSGVQEALVANIVWRLSFGLLFLRGPEKWFLKFKSYFQQQRQFLQVHMFFIIIFIFFIPGRSHPQLGERPWNSFSERIRMMIPMSTQRSFFHSVVSSAVCAFSR